tara:strand:+ start:355 stop:1047 length:693 start_codon:yes stop_codon:yes gene_type:complete
MLIKSELCFNNNNKSIVKSEGWDKDDFLGSAIGEGSNAEIAEDRAINRLKSRLKQISNTILKEELNNNSTTPDKDVLNKLEVTENMSIKNTNESNHIDNKIFSEDWSDELSLIDVELKRLNWDREKENKYIESIFGYSNKNRITKYSEIKLLLKNLQKLNNNISKSELEGDERETLITKTNTLIKELEWTSDTGRHFLIKHFDLTTRQNLNIDQLKRFVVLLEKELLVNK